MTVNRIVKDAELDIDIREITLMTLEEYETYMERIPKLNDYWWLRSPGQFSLSEAAVKPDGSVNREGDYINLGICAIRPVIKFNNTGGSRIEVGEQFVLGGHPFTVIDKEVAIMNDSLGCRYFRKDWKAQDANAYMQSDIKVYIEEWLEKALKG